MEINPIVDKIVHFKKINCKPHGALKCTLLELSVSTCSHEPYMNPCISSIMLIKSSTTLNIVTLDEGPIHSVTYHFSAATSRPISQKPQCI